MSQNVVVHRNNVMSENIRLLFYLKQKYFLLTDFSFFFFFSSSLLLEVGLEWG